MDLHGQIEQICTIKHYHISKIGESVLHRNLAIFQKIQFFGKKYQKFSKKSIFDKSSTDCKFINFEVTMMIYGANHFYLIIQIDWCTFCNRALRAKELTYESIKIKKHALFGDIRAPPARVHKKLKNEIIKSKRIFLRVCIFSISGISTQLKCFEKCFVKKDENF